MAVDLFGRDDIVDKGADEPRKDKGDAEADHAGNDDDGKELFLSEAIAHQPANIFSVKRAFIHGVVIRM